MGRNTSNLLDVFRLILVEPQEGEVVTVSYSDSLPLGYAAMSSADKKHARPTYHSQHLESLASAAQFAQSLGDTGNVYINAANRITGLGNYDRGTARQLTRAKAIALDLDSKGGATYEELRDLALRLPIRPTLLVQTRGGVHAWFSFPEPVPADAVYEAAWKSVIDYVSIESEKRGFGKLDAVGDGARNMRMPLVPMRKKEEDAWFTPTVELIGTDTYTPEQLIEICGGTMPDPSAFDDSPIPTSEEFRYPARALAVCTPERIRTLEQWVLVRGESIDILERAGWEDVGSGYFAHPSSTTGVSCQVYADEQVRVFTDSFVALPANIHGQAYSPWDLAVGLLHDGDRAKALADPWLHKMYVPEGTIAVIRNETAAAAWNSVAQSLVGTGFRGTTEDLTALLFKNKETAHRRAEYTEGILSAAVIMGKQITTEGSEENVELVYSLQDSFEAALAELTACEEAIRNASLNAYPTITITDVNTRDLRRKIIDEIVEHNVSTQFMQQLDKICTVPEHHTGVLKRLEPNPAFDNVVASHVTFVRKERNGRLVVAPVPAGTIAGAYESAVHLGKFPEVVGTSDLPVLSNDGIFHTSKGYQPTTKTYYFGSHIDIPEQPSASEVSEALETVTELVADFEFKDEVDRANYLSLLLSLILRPAMRNVPAYVIMGTGGEGKTLLLKVALILATGQRSPSTAALDFGMVDSEETKKKIFAKLLDYPLVLPEDNIAGKWGSRTLHSLTTGGTTYADRVLGQSAHVSTPYRGIIVATTTGLELMGEMQRRTILVDLSSGVGNPGERVGFRISDLEQHVYDNRGAILRALGILYMAWRSAGRPESLSPIRKLNSFEEWQSICGGVLEFHGIFGLASNREAVESKTTEDETAYAFMSTIQEHFRDGWALASMAFFIEWSGGNPTEDKMSEFIQTERSAAWTALKPTIPVSILSDGAYRNTTVLSRLSDYCKRYQNRPSGPDSLVFYATKNPSKRAPSSFWGVKALPRVGVGSAPSAVPATSKTAPVLQEATTSLNEFIDGL